MPETEEQREARILKELEGKNVAHYTVMLSTWVHTRMERDKTLVTLSAGAIGLLVTILTTVGVSSYEQIIVVFFSFVGFVTCIVSALIIYQLNAGHIESEIRGESNDAPRLRRFDKLSLWSFSIGTGALVVFGLLSAHQFLTTEERDMASKETETKVGTPVTERRSVEGIGTLKPQEPGGSSSGSQSDKGSSNQGGSSDQSKKG
jgi:hypothetical protein